MIEYTKIIRKIKFIQMLPLGAMFVKSVRLILKMIIQRPIGPICFMSDIVEQYFVL